MRRNSGIIGENNITSTSNTNGVHDLFDAFNKVKDDKYQPTIRIAQYANATHNTTSNTYVENSQQFIEVRFSGLLENTTIYYKFLNIQNTTANTFQGRLPGDIAALYDDGDGTFTAYANGYSIHRVNIGIDGRNNKPNTQFKFVYSTGDFYDNGGSIIGESDIFTIPKIAFTEKTFSSASIDEGSAGSNPTIKITADANTFGNLGGLQSGLLFTGMRSGGTANNSEVIYNLRFANNVLIKTKNWGSHSNTDMTAGASSNYYLDGSTSTDTNASYYAEVMGAGDFLTEGSETFNPGFIIVGSGFAGSNAIISATDLTDDEMFTMPQLTISDTSTNATFTVTSNTTSITEGDSVNIVITDTSQSNNNANFFYSLDGTNINANDFSIGTQNELGFITMTGSTANVTITTAIDADTGTENFTVNFRTGSNSGPIVASSNTITLSAAALANVHVAYAENRYGVNIGTIKTYVTSNTGTILATLRTVTGQTGTTAWSFITTPGLTGLSPGTQIRFAWHHLAGSSFRGDYAIDYVRWYKNGALQNWPISNLNYASFENTTQYNSWIRTNGTNTTSSTVALTNSSQIFFSTSTGVGRWNVDSGSTPSSSTGPTAAYNGTYFAYTETSSFFNQNYWLFSPVVTI